jgi:hypothetical protein
MDDDWKLAEIQELRKQLESANVKLDVTTKIMGELLSFKQWADYVYPTAIKDYDAVTAIGGDVIYNLD